MAIFGRSVNNVRSYPQTPLVNNSPVKNATTAQQVNNTNSVESPIDKANVVLKGVETFKEAVTRKGEKTIDDTSVGEFLSKYNKPNVAIRMYGDSSTIKQSESPKYKWVSPRLLEVQKRLYHAGDMQSINYQGEKHPICYWHEGKKDSDQAHITKIIHANEQSCNVVVELDSERASLTDDKEFHKVYKTTSLGHIKEKLSLRIAESKIKSEYNSGGVKYSQDTLELKTKKMVNFIHHHK